MAAIRAYEMALFGRLLDGLEAIPGARVWGITDRSRFEERTPTAAVTFAGHTARGGRPSRWASGGSRRGGATSTPIGPMERLGLEPDGVLRIGLTHYNTAAEVDRLVDELRTITAPPRRLTARCPRRTSRSSAAGSSGRRSPPSSPVAGAVTLHERAVDRRRGVGAQLGRRVAPDGPGPRGAVPRVAAAGTARSRGARGRALPARRRGRAFRLARSRPGS